ncbi:uncharacterized protein LOC130993987 [Salvia miltiorrhiza]|uniref:uncharacterized protein LOC130993987 n=1 Tax=Salvia miltiorrhiza TaxID=226208 RepID=UPI0025AD2996|nr:uncharacterized protein LOC130993987 [Salvia miltiorrhiza]
MRSSFLVENAPLYDLEKVADGIPQSLSILFEEQSVGKRSSLWRSQQILIFCVSDAEIELEFEVFEKQSKLRRTASHEQQRVVFIGALVSARCHLWSLNLLRQHLSAQNFAHVSRFLRYPWGRIAYDFLVPRTHNARKLIDKMKTKQNKLSVEAYGFVHVLQAWMYEIMPSLAGFCGKQVIEHENRIPRMQRWSADSGILFEHLWPYFLPRAGNDPVPIIVSAKEYEMMDELGIPSTMHPASPTLVFNSKSLVRKRRLTYEDVETSEKTEALKGSPLKSSSRGKKKLLSGDPPPSTRLVGKTEQIETKKGHDVDNYAENAAPTPALSKNTVKNNSNLFVILLMKLMEKVDKLDQKVEKIDGKVEHRDTTLHKVVVASIRSYFDNQATSHHPKKCKGEKKNSMEKMGEHKSSGNVCAVLGESSTFQNLDDLGNKGDQLKVSNTGWFSNEWLLEDPFAVHDCNYHEPPKPVPLTDNPVKKSLSVGDSRTKSEGFKGKSFLPRTKEGLGHTMKTEAISSLKIPGETENLLPSLNLDCTTSYSNGMPQKTSMDALKFDPSDFDFNYAELNPFLRWQKAASSGHRRYDRRLPIKMLRVADNEWFNVILERNGWLESEHINALIYLLLVDFNKDVSNPIVRDWSCMEMVCWLGLRSDNLEEMVGTVMPYVRGSLVTQIHDYAV